MLNFLLAFIPRAVVQGIPLLFGSTGEIVTEKSGNLNLGIPGMMYMGGIAGLIAAFYYEKAAAHPNGLVGMILSLLAAFLMAAPEISNACASMHVSTSGSTGVSAGKISSHNSFLSEASGIGKCTM